MGKEEIKEISYKDLSNDQLDNLKDLFIASRISIMSEEDLREFVRIIISDQIKGTVGNEEEREAWKEMKDHFKDDFEEVIKEVLKINSTANEEVSPEKEELTRRLKLLEQRKKEKSDEKEDMW